MPTRLLSSFAFGTLVAVSFAQTANLQAPVLSPKHAHAAVPNFARIAPLLPNLVVRLRPDFAPGLFAATHDLRVLHAFASRGDTYVLAARSVAEATGLRAQLAQDPAVERVYQDRRLPIKKRWEPNDPYYFPNADQQLDGQWHLRNLNNVGGANIDARVWGAWQRDITGAGVTIGICDDSFQTTHPDLAPNYDAADSHDFSDGDGDPDPVFQDDGHGICVAGVAGARGGNGIGTTGAAPLVSMAGLRLPFESGDASGFEDAITYHSSGGNISIQIKNHSYGVSIPYYDGDTATDDALKTSIEAGTVHVWAAGNDRFYPPYAQYGIYGENEDANKASAQTLPGELIVAALGADGKYSYYSSYGANIVATAPSSSDVLGITTTDRLGNLGYNGHPDLDYTTGFGGTSSAAPLVTGVMALVKQAQPDLDGRFAKHLLAISSDIVDPNDASESSDGGWRTNKAGIAFNQDYGFGLIDADRLTANALLYGGVSPLVTSDTGTINVNATIPNNNVHGLNRTFKIAKATPLEEMVVTLELTHPFLGDIEVYLTSPSGTKGRLLVRNYHDGTSGDHLKWRTLSNAFWGENPQGTWKLTVLDTAPEDIGTLNSFQAVAYQGTLTAPLPDRSQFVSQTNVPDSIKKGGFFYPTLTFKNTGTTTWSREEGYCLRSVDPIGNTTWNAGKVYFNVAVPPGATVSVRANSQAPKKVGTYRFRWSIARKNGAIPIGQPSPPVDVVVN